MRSDWAFAKMWKKGDFGSSLEEVKGNVRRCLLPVSQLHHAPPDAMASDGTGGMSHGKAGGVKAEASAMPKGVQFLQGYFSKTLPGPVKRLAFLRADSDMYASIYETLHALYPLLSPGGYVVFDDWKFVQARRRRRFLLGVKALQQRARALHRRHRAPRPTRRAPPTCAGARRDQRLPPEPQHHLPDHVLGRHRPAAVLRLARPHGLLAEERCHGVMVMR